MVELFKLLRPWQYVKNAFVLIGLIFAGQWNLKTFTLAAVAFSAFCAIASAVYIVNDIFDREADRQHPVKRGRPIASGAVSVRTAATIAIGLAVVAMALGAWVGSYALAFLAAYGLLNLGYSLRWKHIAVIDVFIISAGFMLRILVGTVGIGIAPSSWLLLCGLMLTLFLGFAKRRAELNALDGNAIADKAATRRVLDDYSPNMIEQFMSISAACAIISYSLYTVAPDTVTLHHTQGLIATVPLVVYGIFRYLYLLHQEGRGDDAARDLYADRHLLATVVAWAAVALAVLA
jgi:4-hydroxybenzoate polyprenyltransferase